MNDTDCVAFLQWALPRMGLRWPGFRRVRGQVCKRIDRRIQALGLSGTAAYKAYLSEQAAEWEALEALCSIPISRFYAKSSLRELPPEWIDRAFGRRGDLYCLRDRWKGCIEFRHQNIRLEQPAGEFDLILCRNVAFTYFSEPVQRAVLARIAERLRTEGFLVIGKHEALPTGTPFLRTTSALGIYRKLP